ncbi:hypothetical protein MBLNU230_g1417t1 [Neophaeotheca triangularis]
MATSELAFARPLILILNSLTILNDICLPLHQWVVAESQPPDARLAPILRSTIIAVLIYAIAEPLWTKFLLWLSMMPWALQMGAAVLYLLSCESAQSSLRQYFVARGREPEAQAAISRDDKREHPMPEFKHASRPLLLWLLGPLVTAALANAVLLLQSESITAPSMRRGVQLGFNYVALSLYVSCCGYGSFRLSKRLWRQSSLTASGLTSRLGRVILLFALKAAVRMTLGLDPLVSMVTLDEGSAELLWGKHRYDWAGEVLDSTPNWLHWAIMIMGWVLTLARGYWSGRTERTQEV